ncbi:MAG: hypothetical protein WD851_21540 [Pirellulales bacterium]
MKVVQRVVGATALVFATNAAWASEPLLLMPLHNESVTASLESNVNEPTLAPTATLDSPEYVDDSSDAWSDNCGDCYTSCVRCMPCQPLWVVRGGTAILHRSTPDDITIAEPLGGLFQISTGSHFDFDYTAGADISLERRLGNSCNSIEVRYLGALDWDSQVSYDLFGDIGLGASPVIGVDSLDARYSSSLDSTEINFRHQYSDRFTWLVGFRWIELQEDLNFDVNFIIPSLVDFNWNVDNRMYGAQLGGDFQLWRLTGPLRVNSVMKAGVYANNADNDFTFSIVDIPIISGGAGGNQTAFVGEITVNASYQLTQHIALRGGYQLLWIDGVALATNQAAETLAQGDIDVIDTDSDLFYHGALAGVDFVW